MFRPCLLSLAALLCVSALQAQSPPEINNQVIVSVSEQKLMLVQNGAKIATYPISTSKFGTGDGWGKMTTPVGAMAVAQKIGDHAPLGAVFHNRRYTGEILPPNAPGRDPIVTRIIWLRGLQPSNLNAFARCIYIHGTAEERTIGRPASYGCIRMTSKDITALYSQLPLGAIVQVVPDKLPRVPKAKVIYKYQAPDAPVEVGRPPVARAAEQRDSGAQTSAAAGKPVKRRPGSA